MTAEQEEDFDRRDERTGCTVNLYCAKAWAEGGDFNDLSAELIRLGSPSPDSGHPFWRVKWSMGEDPKEDELFLWAQRKAAELKPVAQGMDWVSLAIWLYEGAVEEEAERLSPGHSEGAHEGVGLVFFHLRELLLVTGQPDPLP